MEKKLTETILIFTDHSVPENTCSITLFQLQHTRNVVKITISNVLINGTNLYNEIEKIYARLLLIIRLFPLLHRGFILRNLLSKEPIGRLFIFRLKNKSQFNFYIIYSIRIYGAE